MSSAIIPIEAEKTFSQIDILVVNLQKAETTLEHGYARLGYLLNQVYEKKYWHGLFDSFGDYLTSLSTKYSRGKTTLYYYQGVSQTLAPYMTEEQLDCVGISKARELKRYVETTGAPPSEEVVTQAINPKVTVKDVKKLLFSVREPDNQGTYVCIETYLSEESNKVYRAARECALRASEAVTPTTTETQKDRIFLEVVCMEFLAAHSDRVEQEGS